MRFFLFTLMIACALPMSSAWATMCTERVVDTLPDNTVFAGVFRVVAVDKDIENATHDATLPQIKPAPQYRLETVKAYFGSISSDDVFTTDGAIDLGGEQLVVGAEYKKIILKQDANMTPVIINTRCYKISEDLWNKLENEQMPSGKN